MNHRERNRGTRWCEGDLHCRRQWVDPGSAAYFSGGVQRCLNTKAGGRFLGGA
jgi:hypothetical protein